MNMSLAQSANLHLKFDGANLPTGTIDIYDLSNTILALGQVIEKIAENEEITKHKKIQINVTTLRPGSFDVGISLSFQDIVAAATAVMPLLVVEGSGLALRVLDIFCKVIEVKKFLRGEKPKNVEIVQNGADARAVVYNFSGDKMTVNMPVYNALQNKEIQNGVKKIVEPLTKDGGNIDSIELSSDSADFDLEVNKEEAPYFERTDELQVKSDFKVKGVVTAFDRKTRNGRINVSDSKRITFELAPGTIEQDEKLIGMIIESLKLKVYLYLVGDATLDFESNLKKIKVKDVQSEAKLF